MKRMMIPLLAAVLCAGCVLASFGLLSNDSRQPGQNMFGGFGQIHSTGNPANRFFSLLLSLLLLFATRRLVFCPVL